MTDGGTEGELVIVVEVQKWAKSRNGPQVLGVLDRGKVGSWKSKNLKRGSRNYTLFPSCSKL